MMEASPLVSPAPAKKGQSIFGVISFGVGMVSAALICGGIGLLVFLAFQERGRFDPTSMAALLPAFCALSGGPVGIIGLGAGVIVFFEPNRGRALGMVGIALNLLSLLVLTGVFVLGIIAQGRGLPPNL